MLAGVSKLVNLRPEYDELFGYIGEAIVLEEDGSSLDVMFGIIVEEVNFLHHIWIV
jgi:hypothetical protein